MALLLQEADVRRVLTMERAIGAVENVFRAQAHSEAANFPRQRSVAPGVSVNILCCRIKRARCGSGQVLPDRAP